MNTVNKDQTKYTTHTLDELESLSQKIKSLPIRFFRRSRTDTLLLATATLFVVLMVVSIIGFSEYKKATSKPTPPRHYKTQEQCEMENGSACSFYNCDYIPPEKTFEEVCSAGFQKGWYPVTGANSETTTASTDTSEWKTYADKKFGYQVHYPSTWKIDFGQKDSVLLIPPSAKKQNLEDGIVIILPNYQNTVIENGMTLQEYAENTQTNLKDSIDFEYKSNEFKTLGNREYWLAKGGCCMDIGMHAFFLNDNHIFRITLSNLEDNIAPEELNTFYQILSTFEFTNNNSLTLEEASELVSNRPEVKDYLNKIPDGAANVTVETKEDLYLIHVFEVKNGHTATFNWYEVDKNTGAISTVFDY